MNIPFLDLQLINEPHETQINGAISACVASGWYILGENGKRFEQGYATFCRASHCIATANGLDAISLILMASEFPAKSEIIVPANTYIATILGIMNAGLTPVLVEPDAATFLLDPALIERHLTARTKAIFTVALYGKHGKLDKLRHIADKHNLRLFSDNAQSHGATFQGTTSANWLDAAAYSFYPTKNLGALGDAGAVVTNDGGLAEKIRTLRNYGSSVKYKFDYQGINSRMDEIQAAILTVKLPYLDGLVARRRQIAHTYLHGIRNESIMLPSADTVSEDAWHLFVVKCKNREVFRNFLMQHGIGSDIHYPVPPHKQAAMRDWNHLSFPISEEIHELTVSIPLNQTMTDQQVAYVVSTINTFVL